MIICFGEVLIDCLPNKEVIGGAPFNAFAHLNRFDTEAIMISALGNDQHGFKIKNFLKKENAITSYIQENNNNTGFVTVKFNNKEPQYTIETPCSWQYIKSTSEPKDGKIIIFGSLGTYFNKNKKSFENLITNNPQAKTICDLNIRLPFFDKKHAEFCLENADFIKLNEDEATVLINYYQCTSEKELASYLFRKFNIEACLITKGTEGVFVYTHNTTFHTKITPLSNNQFIDSIGAGDAFTSRFCYGLLKKQSLLENTKASSKFATEICKSQGAIPASKEFYKKFLL